MRPSVVVGENFDPTVRSHHGRERFHIGILLEKEWGNFSSTSLEAATENRLPFVLKFVMWSLGYRFVAFPNESSKASVYGSGRRPALFDVGALVS